MGLHAEHRAAVATLLSGWTLTRIFDANADFTPPEPSSNLQAPARFLAWDIQYDQVERATFGGTVEVNGRVVFGCWVQFKGSDAAAREMADAVRTLFADVTSGSIQFHQPIQGDPIFEGEPTPEWYALPIVVPFTEFRS